MNLSNIYFLIPVFNEEENMSDLVVSLRETSQVFASAKCHFILLNDGSTDNTVETANRLAQAQNLSLTVVSNAVNSGPGAAFQKGFMYVAPLVKADDLVITMEGDNTSRCELLKTMVERQIRESYDVVLASPYAYGGGFTQTSVLRFFLSHMANGMTKLFLKIHGIHTFSSFFRIFTGSSIKLLQERYGDEIIKLKGFECMVELLAKAVHLKLKITEVPMNVDWSKRKGKSKMKIVRTIKGYLRLFLNSQKLLSK